MITLVKWIIDITLSLVSSIALAEEAITLNTIEETINCEVENSNNLECFESNKKNLQRQVTTRQPIVFYQDKL